jgi:hypothetical protein
LRYPARTNTHVTAQIVGFVSSSSRPAKQPGSSSGSIRRKQPAARPRTTTHQFTAEIGHEPARRRRLRVIAVGLFPQPPRHGPPPETP